MGELLAGVARRLMGVACGPMVRVPAHGSWELGDAHGSLELGVARQLVGVRGVPPKSKVARSYLNFEFQNSIGPF